MLIIIPLKRKTFQKTEQFNVFTYNYSLFLSQITSKHHIYFYMESQRSPPSGNTRNVFNNREATKAGLVWPCDPARHCIEDVPSSVLYGTLGGGWSTVDRGTTGWQARRSRLVVPRRACSSLPKTGISGEPCGRSLKRGSPSTTGTRGSVELVVVKMLFSQGMNDSARAVW